MPFAGLKMPESKVTASVAILAASEQSEQSSALRLALHCVRHCFDVALSRFQELALAFQVRSAKAGIRDVVEQREYGVAMARIDLVFFAVEPYELDVSVPAFCRHAFHGDLVPLRN